MSTIVHLTAPAQFGGLERVVSGLAAATAARGHRVVVFASLSPGVSVPPWLPTLAAQGVAVEVLHVGNRAYLRERGAVRALLRRERPLAVHTHGYRSDILHRGVARGLGIGTVSTAHGFASQRSSGLSLNERLQVWSWKHFDRVVSVSTPLLEHLVRLGVPRERLVLIRNGLVAPPRLLPRAEARTALGLAQSAHVVGWVGRMSGEKDPKLAVEAFAAAAVPNAVLCYIGDGPDRHACELHASALGIRDRVRFAGPRDDAATLLAAFDTLLLSSRTEGTPMTILEAAQADVPIVATAVGGVPDVVGADGLLAGAGDAPGLAAALQAVADDRAAAKERAQRLHTRLVEVDRRADWVGRYLELYEALRPG